MDKSAIHSRIQKLRALVDHYRYQFQMLDIEEISPEVLAVTPFYTLHQGETEALMLCMQFVESTLLTDDTAARLAAQSLGVSAHGTLGLLLRAIRRGTRTKEQVSHILAMIPSQSSLHIRPSLLADIIRQTKELH